MLKRLSLMSLLLAGIFAAQTQAHAYGGRTNTRELSYNRQWRHKNPTPTPTNTPAPTPTPTSTSSSGSGSSTGGTVALGAYINDPTLGGQAPQSLSALDAYAQQTGRYPAIAMWFQGWGTSSSAFDTNAMNNALSRSVMPEITWQPWAGSNPDPTYKLTNITAGNFDSYITQFAEAAKAWGHPFYLRFAHEMNGNWYPWGTMSGNAEGNSPADYVAAWRHVHNIFTQVGATNAKWVWCPNRAGNTALDTYSQNYPGDAYVDYVCFDAYNQSYNGYWTEMVPLYQHSYDQLTALTSKPIIVGETASCEQLGSKASWITNGFNALPTDFPRIKAVVWFDQNKECDWRIDSSSSSLAAYQQVVASPIYQASAP